MLDEAFDFCLEMLVACFFFLILAGADGHPPDWGLTFDQFRMLCKWSLSMICIQHFS